MLEEVGSNLGTARIIIGSVGGKLGVLTGPLLEEGRVIVIVGLSGFDVPSVDIVLKTKDGTVRSGDNWENMLMFDGDGVPVVAYWYIVVTEEFGIVEEETWGDDNPENINVVVKFVLVKTVGDGNGEDVEAEFAVSVVEIREEVVTLDTGTVERYIVAVMEDVGVFVVESSPVVPEVADEVCCVRGEVPWFVEYELLLDFIGSLKDVVLDVVSVGASDADLEAVECVVEVVGTRVSDEEVDGVDVAKVEVADGLVESDVVVCLVEVVECVVEMFDELIGLVEVGCGVVPVGDVVALIDVGVVEVDDSARFSLRAAILLSSEPINNII
jgi:hypothetical protein